MSHTTLQRFLNIAVMSYDSLFEKINALVVPKSSQGAMTTLKNLFEFFLPSIRDFIYHVRKGYYEDSMKMRRNIVLLFLATRCDSLYSYAELLNLLVHEFWNERCPDLITMEQQFWTSFNEEVGEVSFSVLARDDFTYGTTFTEDRVTESYVLTPFLRNLALYYSNKKPSSFHQRYKAPNSDDLSVLAVNRELEQFIEELKEGKCYAMDVVRSNRSYQLQNCVKVLHTVNGFPSISPLEMVRTKLNKWKKNFGKKVDKAGPVLKQFVSNNNLP